MSYTPTKWENGVTKVNADNLNKIENALTEISQSVDVIEAEVPDLYQNKAGAIVETVSGEGTVTAKDTADALIKLNGLYGASVQDSTTGAQLLEYPYAHGNGSTSAGITFAVNADGSLSAVGTPTGNATFIFDNDWQPSKGTYAKSKASVGAFMISRYLRETNAYDSIVVTNGTASFSTEDWDFETYRYYVLYQITSTVGAVNTTLYPMINTGTTALPWEPYTGNAPSPSVAYPQEIKKSVVSEIVTHGKNFTDGADWEIGGIMESGLTANKNCGRDSIFRVVKPLTDYVFSSNTQITIIRVCEYDAEKNLLQILVKQGHSKFFAFTTSEKTAFVKCCFYRSGVEITTDMLVSLDLQLEEGTDATDYEPYTETVATLSQPIELNGISDVADVLTPSKIIGEWYLAELTGDETDVTFETNSNGIFRGQFTLPVSVVGAGVACTGLFTHGIHVSALNKYGTVSSAGYKMFVALGENIADEESFRGFLRNELANGRQVKVLLKRSKLVDEELPTADQIALNGLKSFEGTTHIGTDSEVPATIEAECVLDTKRYIDRKFAELQALILES